jgi:hypothetical protein
MSSAILHVEGLAYCELAIENSIPPPSINLIDEISIYDGFGIACPVLELSLYDPSGSLVSDFGFTDATLISITMSKNNSNPKKRTFRCWGWRREMVGSGPVVKVVAILDVPKYSAGSYCESFSKQTSSAALASVADKSGLKSDVDQTVDAMTWLNINQTRSSFSEDVAMRGRISAGSCMARVLTMDKKLRYKDIIKVITGSPKVSFLLNVDKSEASASPVHVREVEHLSGSGLVTHWMNYGWKQYEHDLSGVQKSDLSANAPVLGSRLPINSEVGSMFDNARVTYTGFDPGTAPKPESNLHKDYEKALYQNLRFLALFSERMRILVDGNVEVETFDCCEFKQNDYDGQNFNQNKTFSGKYIVGGRSVKIKSGHKYHEVYDLYRPYINESGKTKTKAPAQKSPSANDGSVTVPESYKPQQGTVAAATEVEAHKTPAVRPNAPAIETAATMLSALAEFDSQTPKIPTVPAAKQSQPVATEKLQTQTKIRESVAALNTGPLAVPASNTTQRELNQMSSTVKLSSSSAQEIFNEGE